MKDKLDINVTTNIINIAPNTRLKICFFVITKPNEENLRLKTLSCKDKAKK